MSFWTHCKKRKTIKKKKKYFSSQCLMLFNCLPLSAFSISCVGSLVVEIFSFFVILAVFSITASSIFIKSLKSIGLIVSLSSSSAEEDISDVPLSSLRFWLRSHFLLISLLFDIFCCFPCMEYIYIDPLDQPVSQLPFHSLVLFYRFQLGSVPVCYTARPPSHYPL
jgi:hypothetical protein